MSALPRPGGWWTIPVLAATARAGEGIRRVLELEEEVRQLRTRLQRYEHEERSTALVVWRPGRR
ncbi:MAG: hypothetical protein IPG68_12780 [Micrococcales bacterium]|nr:hypothetical protein [Micrococcales bacterium]